MSFLLLMSALAAIAWLAQRAFATAPDARAALRFGAAGAFRLTGVDHFLRYWGGIGLAVMLAFLVIANVNVALKGTGVEGIDAGAWYFWTRPFFQPLIMLWVLYAAGVVYPHRTISDELPASR